MTTFQIQDSHILPERRLIEIIGKRSNQIADQCHFLLDPEDVPGLIEALQEYYENLQRRQVHPAQGQLFDPDNY